MSRKMFPIILMAFVVLVLSKSEATAQSCPQRGLWTGTTNQGRSISFNVSNTPNCQVMNGQSQIRIWCDGGCWMTVNQGFGPTPISSGHFDTGPAGITTVIGDFTSSTTANGTWIAAFIDPFGCGYCSGSGTWTATPTLIADFSGYPTSGVAPLTVQFTDESTGTIQSWLWDFGDQVTSTSQSPTYVYTAAGAYTVTLTVDGLEGTDTLTRMNYITAEPYTVYLPLIFRNY